MKKEKVIFAISQLNGGGAEHVIMQLANHFVNNDHEVLLLITNQKSEVADVNGLDERVNRIYLEDSFQKKKHKTLYKKSIGIMCKIFEKLWKKVPYFLVKESFQNVYGEHVVAAKSILQNCIDWKVVVFLQPANQIMLKACKDLGIKIIISERGDPIRYFKTRYADLFLRFYYTAVSGAVFQTEDAMKKYSMIQTMNQRIIYNPIPSSLPLPYEGERKKRIVNFCRLAKQKNIPLLMDAFDDFADEHSDYILEIIGSGELKEELMHYRRKKKHSDRIFLKEHQQGLHESIKDYAMFVSSSDYEGMSNSMLEAMAIGLPVICTDCPIGGAKTVIKDHENGLLVPVGDKDALVMAMKELAEHKELSEKLSKNASEIRKKQSVEMVGEQWLQVINNA